MSDRIVRVILRGDIVGLKAAMSEGASVVTATADKMTAVTKEAEKSRQGLVALGSQAGKVGLVAAVGLGVAVKSAADFNAEMALVRTLSHANASDMEKLSHAALTVGQNIGYTAKSVAQGEEELVKAGVSVKDILGGGLKGALDLAAAGQTDVATATSIAAAALTEFELKGKDVPHVADLLAAGADKALGSVEDLGLGLTQAGTTANQMGLSIEQTVGTLTAFAQAGLIGERGGTTFKQMLLKLSAPSVQAQKIMDKLGLSLYDANGQIKTMPELAGNLQSSLQNLTPAARNSALGIIFGSRAIQGANILMANGQQGIQGWIDKTNDQGFAAQQAAGKLDSLSGDLTKLKAAMQTAFIGIGSGSQSPLRSLTQDATAATTAFNKMPTSLHNTVAGMLAITAITGGGLWFSSRVIRSIGDTRAALDKLGVSEETTSKALRGLGTAALSIGVLYGVAEGVDALKKSMDRSIPSVNALTNDLLGLSTARGVQAITSDIGNLGSALNEIKDPGVFNAIDKFYAKIPVLGKIGQVTTGSVLDAFTGGASDQATRSLREATDAVGALDAALANIVTSGSPEQAQAVFSQLATTYGLTTAQQDQLLKLMPQYRDALAGVSAQGKLAAGAAGDLATAQTASGKSALQAAADQKVAMKAWEETRKAARQTAQQFFGVGKAVNNTKVSLDSWIKDMEKQAAALRDFTKNAQTAGKRGLREGLIKELEAAGPEGALRMKQLADGTDAEIKRANKAWKSGQDAVAAYVKFVAGVPPSVATTLELRDAAAQSALARILRQMQQIPKRLQTDYYVIQHNALVKPRVLPGSPDGAPVKPASGGRIVGPGTGTSDSIPAYVSNGEYVIKAAAVEKYGVATFDRLNAMRFASGGTPGTHPGLSTYSASPSVTVYFPTPAALAAAVNAANRIAADAVRVARTAADIRQQGLDDLHTQQQIRDLQQQLHERNKKHRLVLRGLDREAAKAELADAKAQLVEIRNQAKQARDDARKQAIADLTQKRNDEMATLTRAGDIFGGGTSARSAVSSVNRAIADISQYGQVIAQLKSKGASPALLAQIIAKADAGDFRSAIRLGQALLAQPALLGQLNTALATLGTTSSAVATMVTDPRFLSAARWSPASTKIVQVNLAADPTSWMTELKRVVTFEVEAAMAKATR